MLPFLKLIRFNNLLIIALTQCLVRYCLIYPDLKTYGFALQMSDFYFILLVLSTVLIAAAGYIINDYFDVEIDKINKPERVIVGNFISKENTLKLYWIFNTVGLFMGIYLCFKLGLWKWSFIFISWVVLFYFYSSIFKKKFLIGNLIVALVIASYPDIVGFFEVRLFIISYPFEIDYDIPLAFYDDILFISFFAFIITLIRELIKDMEDYEGDKILGCKTIPILLGLKTTKFIIVLNAFVIIVGLFFVQLFVSKFTLFYFLIFIQIPLLYLIYKIFSAKGKDDFSFASNIAKLIMITGLCYLILFSILSNAKLI